MEQRNNKVNAFSSRREWLLIWINFTGWSGGRRHWAAQSWLSTSFMPTYGVTLIHREPVSNAFGRLSQRSTWKSKRDIVSGWYVHIYHVPTATEETYDLYYHVPYFPDYKSYCFSQVGCSCDLYSGATYTWKNIEFCRQTLLLRADVSLMCSWMTSIVRAYPVDILPALYYFIHVMTFIPRWRRVCFWSSGVWNKLPAKKKMRLILQCSL